MTDELKLLPMQQNKVFTQEVRGIQYTYYLTGPIVEPEEYVDLCNILRSCGPQDEVIIRINSRGGYIASERMIVNAIRECQGTVKGFIEYDCMSAATGVFLACHSHGWGEHIQFMAHCSWWGSVGKNPDIKSQTEFGLKQMEEEINTTYSGLLSPEELQQCNDGKEFWFGAKELEDRMMKYYEYLDSLDEECSCGECNLDNDDESKLDLFGMIKEAVREVMEEKDGLDREAYKEWLDLATKRKDPVPEEATETLKEKPKRRPRQKDLSENKELG